MNPTRNKARLLARVSSLAILAAAGGFGVVQEAQAACGSTWDTAVDGATINANNTCVVVSAPVTGDLTNGALIGDPGPGFVPFDVYNDISGDLINNGNIFGGGGEGGAGALYIHSGAEIFGQLTNNGNITSTIGNALQIGGGESGGFIDNGIFNNGDISSGGSYGVAAIFGSLSGGLTNATDATINGGLAGIFVGDAFNFWDDGIQNFGQISGLGAGIKLGDGGEVSSLTFSGGIVNDFEASINSGNGTAIVINTDVASFSGGITNYSVISGGANGINVSAQAYSGGLYNAGSIHGASGTGARFDVGTFAGDVTNYGTISGGGEFGAGLFLKADTLGGETGTNVTNYNSITGPSQGVVILGDAAHANFSNTSSDPINHVPPGSISGGGTGVVIAPNSWTGNVTNDGSITGNNYGLLVGATNFDGFNERTVSFNGNIVNTGTIDGGEGTGVYVAIGGEFGSFTGDITNDGHIEGGSKGLVVQGNVLFGGECGSGPCFAATGSFDGTITNNSTINGGSYGAVVSVPDFEGSFVNNGTITGNVGLSLGVSTDDFFFGKSSFVGNFTNEGTISGSATGVSISFGSIIGNITNNGTIEGFSTDTGLQVIAGTMTGNVVNNVILSASSNALDVQIGTLNGQVTNNGTITSLLGGQAVFLDIANGTAPNPTIFENNGDIEGDVLFSGTTGIYRYVGGDGSINGDLNGVGVGGVNNDTIMVTGDHYFFGGKAQNFSTFTVANGGTAIMGTDTIGTPGSGYSFNNVDAVAVNNGGTLFIDKSTTLNVDDSYTQAAGGTLMFYLGAPGGSGFGSLTGTQVAGPNDYGQLIIGTGGTVSLNGIIAGWLDPAFASANPGLTEVQYNDVIIAPNAGAIFGDFTATALIANNSLYELNSLIDDNTVDLRVNRTSIGQSATVANVVGTLDPFDSNIADRANGIGSGGCGLAALGGGSCFNRFAANDSPGATQVMTDASPGEDPFAWLRTGVRRVGETAVWGRAVGVWGDTNGQGTIPGSDFSLGGAIAGVDHVFSPLLLAGVAAQWTSTDVEFKNVQDNADVDSFEIGAYGSYGDTRLFVNANVSYIWHNFDVNRFSVATTAKGKYDGDTISAYVEGGKIFETEDGWRLQPVIALSYSHLETDAYSETGVGTLLDILKADLDSLKSMIGARFAHPFTMQSGRKIVPEGRLIWSHEFLDDHSSHFADVQGGGFNPVLVNGEEFSRDSLILGAGLTAPITDASTVFFDYDAGLNNDVTSHTLSAGFRTRW